MGTGEKEEKTGERTAKNMVKEVLSMALYIAVVLCITFLVVRYVGQRNKDIKTTLKEKLLFSNVEVSNC